MIKRLIHKLRRKPKEARDRVAFGIAASFTVAVFMVWAYHAPSKLTAVLGSDSAGGGAAAVSNIFDSIGEQVDAAKASMVVPETTTDEAADFDIEAWQEYQRANTPVESATSATSTRVMNTGSSTATTTSSGALRASTTEPRPVRIVTTPQSTTSTSSQSNR